MINKDNQLFVRVFFFKTVKLIFRCRDW